jgi:hypothetical protein
MDTPPTDSTKKPNTTKKQEPDLASKKEAFQEMIRKTINPDPITEYDATRIHIENMSAFREGELRAWFQFGYDQMIKQLENMLEQAIRQGELDAVRHVAAEHALDQMSKPENKIGFTSKPTPKKA